MRAQQAISFKNMRKVQKMPIRKEQFGITSSGQPVYQYILSNKNDMRVCVLDYGCTIQSIYVPDKDGCLRDVNLGYSDIAAYEVNDGYLGAFIGRHANRIGEGQFTLHGKNYQLAVNNGPNHLHGGLIGFDKKIFACIQSENDLKFSYRSADGEEGYPGNLDVIVTYSLSDDNKLRLHYRAVSDADTVVNLTNHAYFNLNGEASGTVLDHLLTVYASSYTENDADCLPTGIIADVAGTPFDFRSEKIIGRDINMENTQLLHGSGYDHNFILDGDAVSKHAARLASLDSGIVMDTYTTKPGIQIYTANFMTKRQGKSGIYNKRDAVCLETQYFPNAMAHPHFPSPVLKAGAIYEHETIYQFNVIK